MTAGPAAAARMAPTRGRGGAVVSRVLAPVLFGVAVLGLWQWLVRGFDIPRFVLPAPTDIASSFGADHAAIVKAALSTGANALVGLLIGMIVALLLAALAARFRLADEMLTPLAAAAAVIPIVALAPLLNNMFSPVSPIPRRLVVAISVFVPVFVNVVRGLTRVSAVHAELMASYAASGGQVLRYVRIPTALPYFFTGLRIAASLAVISAVVAEYFGGLQKGLGPRITSAVGASDYPGAWASVLGAILLGLVFYLAALALEGVVMRRRAVS